MSLLSRIVDALAPPYDPVSEPAGPPPVQIEGSPPPQTPERTRMATPSDLAMILDLRAEREGRGRGWRDQLDELLALMGVEASRAEKDQMAAELNVADEGGDRDESLHRALLLRLANNGAVAPESYYK